MIDYGKYTATHKFKLYRTCLSTNEHVQTMVGWLMLWTIMWKYQVHIYWSLRNIDVVVPIRCGLICDLMRTVQPQQGILFFSKSGRGCRVLARQQSYETLCQ